MTQKLINLWNFLNGKKTVIGGTILLALSILTTFENQFLVGIWHVTLPSWNPQILSSLQWVGSVLTGVGLLHKAVKS